MNEMLRFNTTLTCFDISVATFAYSLQLTILILLQKRNRIGLIDEAIESLCDGICNNNTIKTLDISVRLSEKGIIPSMISPPSPGKPFYSLRNATSCQDACKQLHNHWPQFFCKYSFPHNILELSQVWPVELAQSDRLFWLLVAGRSIGKEPVYYQTGSFGKWMIG